MIKRSLFLAFALLLAWACSSPKNEKSNPELQEIKLDYAVGFRLYQGDGYKVIEVTKGFPGNHQPFRYLVKEDSTIDVPEGSYDAIISTSVQKIILTSTTQVPHLDALGLTKRLIAFPNLELVSSAPVRKRIDAGQVEELGSGANYNTEKIIDISPDLLMISTLGDNLKDLQLLTKADIPTVINGDYVEQHPLGRAEWIKFTGALTGTYQEAETHFDNIKNNYLSLKEKVQNASFTSLPTVLSGNMYRDIWYAPAGNNWGAIFLEDAGADYVFKDQESTGSLQLNYEVVLDKGLNAAIWISTAEFGTLQQMKEADSRYTQFKAFETGNVYTFANTRGATGGLEYFELGYTRPDIILKDLIKIFHPSLIPEYKPYFYQKLN
ncbi:iron ABC transporter substrate-binding protein [Echinicola strongylocentroti]|uniref:Iron ABC transporter substrate-binding protein n=1 Tax=Echinicola strongylocentroti TaxID=1795355 RepID=A0A2Z4IFC5_9BACT|nr:ABC transporter substrate-binding protein [Echinicola strongylocentroti]AWW29801.1 iron ABC transporter substrate-binding protein [Echinicola strongylocentroti]